jgi:N-acetylglucosaminyldiphosphoundecaprenol N-acetyl-beta-D-mannosaminyltransferase
MADRPRFSDRVRVVSLTPNVLSLESAVLAIDSLVRARAGGYVCFSTVHMVMESYDDPEFGKKVNDANLIVPDGMPLVWMQRHLGRGEAQRIRANDLMIALCNHAAKNGLTVGFYGGKQEVIDAIRARAEIEFSNLRIAYAYSPPFRPLTEDEDAAIVSEINAASPDILFVGLGCPKQENWMAAHRDKLKCVILGVGASFDFYAGNIRECPVWIGSLGLEWLFRLMQEPKRLWRRYLILNPRFMFLAAMQLVKGRKRDR